MRYHTRHAAAALLCILILALVAGCVPPTPTPGPTPTPTPSDEETARIQQECATSAKAGRAKQQEVPKGSRLSPYAGLMYVDGQVLVGGQREAIDDLIAKRGLPLRPFKEDPGITAGKEVIQLFEITDPQASVELVTCLINAYAGRAGLPVYADPNYAVTPAGWHGGGSPWTQNGAWAQNGGGLGRADRKAFVNQWALGDKGIELWDSPGKRSVAAEGKDIVIGVFDTSPFTKLPTDRPFFADAFGDSLGSPAASAGQLILHDAGPQAIPTCPGVDRVTPAIRREEFNLSNHGLFVASLAHAVAPQSDVYLVRVLGDDACGDLATILRGLDWFQTQMTGEEKPGLDKAVINLSLGLNRPDEAEAKALGLPPGAEVRTLQAKIQDLLDNGATVVAAAGNDSFDQASADEAEIPARDKGVIAVAASTVEGQRGCFSNAGELAAPGGDGVGPDYQPSNARLGRDKKPLCSVPSQIPSVAGANPRPSDPWVCEKDARPCLVGLVWRDGESQFAYWVGTSFATPLVSGLAALMIETNPTEEPVEAELTSCPSPVAPGDSLGCGIVNINRALPD